MIAAASVRRPFAAETPDVRAPAKTQWASVAAWPLEALFATFSSRLGGDVEPLAEDAIARLVEQARAGDSEARRQLYTQHVDRVFRTVRGMLRSDADAEDVTQDALLTVLTSLGRTRLVPTRVSRPGSRPSPSTRCAGGFAAGVPS